MSTDNAHAMIQQATQLVEVKLREHPDFRPLLSIKAQLAYLTDYISRVAEGSRLKDINIGLVAAREIEGWDDDLANLLHQIAVQVRILQMADALKNQ
nr:immunity protein Tsi6 family protein [uncultured Acidocella sp.]